MAAPSFYNQGDQAIYESGQHFVPQEKYRLGYTAPTVEEEKITETFGIPATQAFTNSGGSGGGGGPTGNLINNFNTATGNRQYNLNNPNKVQGFVNKGMEMFGMTPQRSVNEMTSPQSLGKYSRSLNNGMTSFGLDQPVNADGTFAGQGAFGNMPANPEVDVRKTSGIPFGIGAMIARGLPDKYYGMSLADQAYTQANMGYTGPTVFGENTTGLSQDPFGRNVRSFGGNYGEAQQKSIDKFQDLVDNDPRYAGLSLDEDEDGNYSLKGTSKHYSSLAEANRMNKMNLAKFSFDQRGISERDLINKNIINQNKRRAAYEKETGRELDAADKAFADTGDYDEYAGAGGTPNYSIPDTNDPGGGRGYSEARNTAGIQSAEDDMKDGGRAGYFFGGRARLQGGGMSQGNEANISQSTNMGGGAAGDYSTMEQNMNHRKAIRNNQREQSSTLNNAIDTGSELNYLNNLKNFNVPGLIFGFGVNKFRNYLDNRKTKEEDNKLSALPNNSYVATAYDTPDGHLPYSGDNYDYNNGMLNTPDNPETLNLNNGGLASIL